MCRRELVLVNSVLPLSTVIVMWFVRDVVHCNKFDDIESSRQLDETGKCTGLLSIVTHYKSLLPGLL